MIKWRLNEMKEVQLTTRWVVKDTSLRRLSKPSSRVQTRSASSSGKILLLPRRRYAKILVVQESENWVPRKPSKPPWFIIGIFLVCHLRIFKGVSVSIPFLNVFEANHDKSMGYFLAFVKPGTAPSDKPAYVCVCGFLYQQGWNYVEITSATACRPEHLDHLNHLMICIYLFVVQQVAPSTGQYQSVAILEGRRGRCSVRRSKTSSDDSSWRPSAFFVACNGDLVGYWEIIFRYWILPITWTYGDDAIHVEKLGSFFLYCQGLEHVHPYQLDHGSQEDSWDGKPEIGELQDFSW